MVFLQEIQLFWDIMLCSWVNGSCSTKVSGTSFLVSCSYNCLRDTTILLNVWTDFTKITNRKLVFQIWRRNGIHICPVGHQRG